MTLFEPCRSFFTHIFIDIHVYYMLFRCIIMFPYCTVLCCSLLYYLVYIFHAKVYFIEYIYNYDTSMNFTKYFANCFVDLEKAFDKMPRDRAFEAMRSM